MGNGECNFSECCPEKPIEANFQGFFSNQPKKNKITIFYEIDNKDEEIKLFGSEFFERNKEKCRIVIDFFESELKEKYRPKKDIKELKVTLEIKNDTTDLSYMFHGCSSLISLPDLGNLNISNITNISHLFSECPLLEEITDDISRMEN